MLATCITVGAPPPRLIKRFCVGALARPLAGETAATSSHRAEVEQEAPRGVQWVQTEDFAEKSSVNQTHSKPKRKAQEDAEECPQRASIGRSRWPCPSALHEVQKRRPRRNGARLDVSHRFTPLGARNTVLDVDLHLVLTTQQASDASTRVKSAGHGKLSRADSIGERFGLQNSTGCLAER